MIKMMAVLLHYFCYLWINIELSWRYPSHYLVKVDMVKYVFSVDYLCILQVAYGENNLLILFAQCFKRLPMRKVMFWGLGLSLIFFFVMLFWSIDCWAQMSASMFLFRSLTAGAPDSDKKDLLSELEVMKTLKPHPHVIKLIGCVTVSGKLAIGTHPVIATFTLDDISKQSLDEAEYGIKNCAHGKICTSLHEIFATCLFRDFDVHVLWDT